MPLAEPGSFNTTDAVCGRLTEPADHCLGQTTGHRTAISTCQSSGAISANPVSSSTRLRR